MPFHLTDAAAKRFEFGEDQLRVAIRGQRGLQTGGTDEVSIAGSRRAGRVQAGALPGESVQVSVSREARVDKNTAPTTAANPSNTNAEPMKVKSTELGV